MASTTIASLLTEHTLSITTFMIPGIVLLLCYFMSRRNANKLPPLAREGYYQTVQIFMVGKNAPQFLLRTMRELGTVYRLRMPEMQHWVTVCDPAFARAILMEEHEKPAAYRRFRALTDGTPTVFSQFTEGENWGPQRKNLASSFSMNSICDSLPKIYEKIEELKKILLEHENDGSTVEILDLMSTLTMDFICAAMFGVDYCTMQSENSPGRILMREFELAEKEFALKQIFNPFRFLQFWDSDLKSATLAGKNIRAAQTKILDNYRASKTPEEIKKDKSIISHIVTGPYKSDAERCADMTIFMIAGHDTTAATVAWIIIEVAKNAIVYGELIAEIQRVSPGDKAVSREQLDKLTYLDNVIKEGMRLWPATALGVARETSKELKYKDMVIPKGSIVSMPSYCIMRSNIEDPDCFIPGRWAAGAPEVKKLEEMFIPFSAGKRSCIGKNLAMLETKLVLANLFKYFRFELTTVVTSDYFLTLKPENAHFRVHRTNKV